MIILNTQIIRLITKRIELIRQIDFSIEKLRKIQNKIFIQNIVIPASKMGSLIMKVIINILLYKFTFTVSSAPPPVRDATE